jgi:hypothetical protein
VTFYFFRIDFVAHPESAMENMEYPLIPPAAKAVAE